LPSNGQIVKNGGRGMKPEWQWINDNITFDCKLCGLKDIRTGHFLSQGGYACDKCNMTKVLPARLKGEHL
tara:strand:+ start:256 stop:465 length:210 start_codon:yes stop_codon:yes gene_type:complete